MKDVPSHKSEKMFRRYESHIFQILQQFPKACSFDPRPLSASTFIARLRDAMLSVVEYQWTTVVNVAKLRDVRRQIICVTIDGMVVVHERGSGPIEPAGVIVGAGQDDFIFTLDNPEETVLYAAALLQDRKVIQKPIKLKNCSWEFIERATKAFDVAISDDSRGFRVMF